MHEVTDDQRGLHKRQAQQNGQHFSGLHILIRQIDFHGGHQQERAPNPEEQRFAVMAVLLGKPLPDIYFKGIHIPPGPREPLPPSDRPKEKLTSRRGPRKARTSRATPTRTQRNTWASA